MNAQRRKYHSIPLRRQAHTITTERIPTTPRQSYASHAQMPALPDETDLYQSTRTPNSALRYRDTEGNDVIQQGNKRVVVRHVRARGRGRVHWLVPVGLTIAGMLLVYVILTAAIPAWNTHELDSQYGSPRTWQTDQVVGHNHDSAMRLSHFIFQNLSGHVIFIEIPAGDIAKARIYGVTTLYGTDATLTPITADFRDVNGDGKIDILIHLGTQGTIVFLNTGTGFTPSP